MSSKHPQPETIGPYHIQGLLGEGGMGVVYRAQHQDTGDWVALKTVRIPNQQWLSSIRREMWTLSRLRHPGVVRVVATGVEQGLPWYAMELIEGLTLERYCLNLALKGGVADIFKDYLVQPTRVVYVGEDEAKTEETDLSSSKQAQNSTEAEGRFKVAAAAQLPAVLTVMRRLCLTLAFIHGEGVVHRDLKPANILIQSNGAMVLVDFGVMSQFTTKISRESVQMGFQVGTALYMAPEQAQGELVDARADLYSVGCLLYELVAGRPVFTGTSASGISMQHICEPPPPPSTWVTGIPPALEELILALLAKRPGERPGHAQDVAQHLLDLGADPSPFYADHKPRAYLYRPEMVERREPLGVITDMLSPRSEDPPRLVLVGGEGGVGKTRLATAVVRHAESHGTRVVIGECAGGASGLGSGSIAPLLQPFRPLLQAIADQCRERGPNETEALLGTHGRLLEMFEPSLESLPGMKEQPEPPVLPPKVARFRLFTALGQVLVRFALRERALLIVIDDLHSADELTLDFLDFALRHKVLDQGRVMVLATHRSEESRERLRPFLTDSSVTQINLKRLSPVGIKAMICDMLAMETPPEAFVRFLVRESEGIPFFVAEYLRTALVEGLIDRDDQGQWHLAEDYDTAALQGYDEAFNLPTTLRTLFEKRLRDLSDTARPLLELAAVIGREIHESFLLRDLSGLPPESIMDGVSELLQKHILVIHGPDKMRFMHDKFREVVHHQIALDRRQALHLALAETMSELEEPNLPVLADHWRQAGENDRARKCYFAAAKEGSARFAYEEAELLYMKGLRLSNDADPETLRARVQLAGGVLVVQGRTLDAIAQYHHALSQARDLDDRAAQGLVLHELSRVLSQTGRFAEAEDVCRQGLEIHRELKMIAREGEGLNRLADIRWLVGDVEAADGLYKRALIIHRQVNNRLYEGQTLGDMAGVYHKQGRLEDAQRLYEKALEILRELGQSRYEAITLSDLAELAAAQQYFDKADMLQQEALVIHRQVGDRRLEALSLAHIGAIHTSRGQLGEGLALLQQALQLQATVYDPHIEAQLLAQLAGVYATQGDMVQARQCCEKALQLYRRMGDRRGQSEACVVQARVEYIDGQLEEAWVLLEEALALREQARNRGNLGEILKALADVHSDQGELRDARSYYDHALEQFEAFTDRAGRWATELSVVRLARRTGSETTETLKVRLQALEVRLRSAELWIEVALCVCERGHVALAAGRSALEFLAEAREIAEKAGVQRYSGLHCAIERLERAEEATRNGLGMMIRGERLGDIPEGLRQQISALGRR